MTRVDRISLTADSALSPEDVASNFHRIGHASGPEFDECARVVLDYQRRANSVYARFEGFKYLPIEAFKKSVVATFPSEEAEAVFYSSGTGGREQRSRHYVRFLEIYRRSVVTHFEQVFGAGPFEIAAHLPSHGIGGSESSLVTMVQIMIDSFGTRTSHFFAKGTSSLTDAAQRSTDEGNRLLLFGTAFGLLSLVDSQKFRLPTQSIVIETGGMKTHRSEIGRKELHLRLAESFGIHVAGVRSEYGMCELLSQCYQGSDDLFYPPPWMRFEIHDPENPGRKMEDGRSGALAILDLANIYSVSAILTEDLAVKHGDGFELLGRLSRAELRGCNFLMEDLVGKAGDQG